MDIRAGVGDFAGWLAVSKPTEKVLQYIRYSVPPVYRVYEDGTWYIHSKYAGNVSGLANSTTSVTDDDPYAVLHLRPDAPPAIIKAVWRELAKSLHPDRGGDKEAFLRAKSAYDKLIKE